MEPEAEREIGHIWERVRSHDVAVSGVAVLQVKMDYILEELKSMKSGRRWIIAQFIASMGVVATLIGNVIVR